MVLGNWIQIWGKMEYDFKLYKKFYFKLKIFNMKVKIKIFLEDNIGDNFINLNQEKSCQLY